MFESNGDLLAASGSGDVFSYNSAGGFLGPLVPAGSGGLSTPIHLVIETSGVPEPSSLSLAVVGACCVLAWARARSIRSR